MRVVKRFEETKGVVHDTFADISIEAFLGYQASEKPKPAPTTPVFTKDDAEYALKVIAQGAGQVVKIGCPARAREIA